jgi:integrase
MAKMAERKGLSVKIKEEGFHRDRGDGAVRGLYLQVSQSERNGIKSAAHGVTRSWIYRYVSPVTGKSRWMGLGPADVIGLADARELASEARKKARLGHDPIDERRAERMAKRIERAKRLSFRECADQFLKIHSPTWRNDTHRRQWHTTLATYAHPVIGALPVAEIDVALVLKVLTPVWGRAPETASRLRGRIEKVLDWATVRKFREGDNPARWSGHLEHMLPALSRGEKHHAALPFTELPAFMADLREREAIPARALEFVILTAARTTEATGAKWEEIDGDVWTVPAERMKGGKAHRVPLSDRALKILEGMPRDGSGFVFPGTMDGKPMSRPTMLRELRGKHAAGITTHGFRSTFSDWARERTNYPRDVVEMALAHIIKDKTEAAYRRGDLLPKRAKLMQAWADYCSAPAVAATVTPIRAAG